MKLGVRRQLVGDALIGFLPNLTAVLARGEGLPIVPTTPEPVPPATPPTPHSQAIGSAGHGGPLRVAAFRLQATGRTQVGAARCVVLCVSSPAGFGTLGAVAETGTLCSFDFNGPRPTTDQAAIRPRFQVMCVVPGFGGFSARVWFWWVVVVMQHANLVHGSGWPLVWWKTSQQAGGGYWVVWHKLSGDNAHRDAARAPSCSATLRGLRNYYSTLKSTAGGAIAPPVAGRPRQGRSLEG